jgi:hypothetical protein
MAGNLVWVVLVSISLTTQSSPPQTSATSPTEHFEHYILTRSGFVVESSAVLNYFTPEYVYCDGGKSWTCASDFYPNPYTRLTPVTKPISNSRERMDGDLFCVVTRKLSGLG